ncbi:MAG TPA: nodulation protein NfeD [Acidobacteriaceae bacterium]
MPYSSRGLGWGSSLKSSRREASTSLFVIRLAIFLLLAVTGLRAQTSQPIVVGLRLQDTIQPISEDYFNRALNHAADIHANAMLIELDTPGGLLSTTRNMVGRIGSSPVPVIVYVSPEGARAGSAGFFLLEAADIAAMAPGTNAGASHPVVAGAKLDDTMKQKIENDAAALLRSYTAQRGRNPKAAEDAVRNSKSYTAQESKDLGLIDIVAPDRTALLNQIDGRTVTRMDGTKTVLHTKNASIDVVIPTLRDRVLDRLMNPDLAVLMLVIGGLLIYLEFNAPGTIVPGTIGTLLVLMSLFALNLLPVHYTAVMLLIAAAILLVLEVKFASHGILAFAGIICLVLGMLTLVEGPIPQMRVHAGTAIAAGVAFGLITVFLVRIAVRARHNKSLVGADALLGQIAIVTKPLEPVGQVMVHGEIWQAHSSTPAPRDAQVRVTAVDGLTLMVEPLRPPA